MREIMNVEVKQRKQNLEGGNRHGGCCHKQIDWSKAQAPLAVAMAEILARLQGLGA